MVIDCRGVIFTLIAGEGCTLLRPEQSFTHIHIASPDAAALLLYLGSDLEVPVTDVVHSGGGTVLLRVHSVVHGIPNAINFAASFQILGFPGIFFLFKGACVLLAHPGHFLILFVLVTFIVKTELLPLVTQVNKIFFQHLTPDLMENTDTS